jgi:RNA polymerase sigma-70 factor (ECF subfamily)
MIATPIHSGMGETMNNVSPMPVEAGRTLNDAASRQTDGSRTLRQVEVQLRQDIAAVAAARTDSERFTALGSLSAAFLARYRHNGLEVDLDNAIANLRDALALLPPGDRYQEARADATSNLAVMLSYRPRDHAEARAGQEGLRRGRLADADELPEARRAPVITSPPSAADFNDFFRTHWTQLLRYCRVQGADDITAEDIVQEVFIKIYSRWDTFAAVGNQSRYAQVMVRNALVDHHRRAVRTVLLDSEAWDSLTEDLEAAPSEAAIEVLDALKALPTRQRQIMSLLLAGSRTQEIADALGMTPSTVRVHIFQARRRLAVIMTTDSSSA